MTDPKANVQFIHIRDNLRRPIMTVAYNVSSESCKLRYGWALRNPQDRYSKERGRSIAEGRLMSCAPRPWHKMVKEAAAATTEQERGRCKRREREYVLRLVECNASLSSNVRKYLALRIKALQAPTPETQEMEGLNTSKGKEDCMRAIIKDEAVYVTFDRDVERTSGPKNNGPLPLSWLLKQFKSGGGTWKLSFVKDPA